MSFAEFFLKCVENVLYDKDAWEICTVFTKKLYDIDLNPLIHANNSYALRLKDMLTDKVNP